jgi:hypothetical protein
LGEGPAFAGNEIGQDNVEGGDAIRGNEEEVVLPLIDVTDFALVEELGVAHGKRGRMRDFDFSCNGLLRGTPISLWSPARHE